LTTRIGEILPGKKLDPWYPGMEPYLPDGADVIITHDNLMSQAYEVQTLDDWHSKSQAVWYVHRDNVKVKRLPLKESQ
jgi:hypothetical protein